MKLNIAHLYPDLLNLYGDRGNIAALKQRSLWRGISAEVTEYTLAQEIDFDNADIIFIGGGSDREQKLVCGRLLEMKDKIIDFAQNNGSIIAVCGGYQLLGRYYKLGDETIEGLGLLDIITERGEKRLIGNVVIKTDFLDRPVVGFENHGGRTEINGCSPLGKVLYGHGNNGTDGTEGVIYKNVIATYLHGPLLPKNPHLCDYIIKNALTKKYGDVTLEPLDDKEEIAANDYIFNRFCN